MSVKPELSESAQRLYDQLAPTFFREDEEYGWAGAIFVTGLCRMIDPAAAIVQPQGEQPGFAVMACPQQLDDEAFLAWIGQFVGVTAKKLSTANRAGFTPEEILAVQRGWVEHPIGFQRGGDAAEELVVKATLTGTKTIFFYPRYNGEAFLLKVITLTGETPNPQETEEELLAVLPAWIVLDYETVEGGTYAILEAAGATYADIEGFHATYASMEAHPEET
jgi:hypothetical protein